MWLLHVEASARKESVLCGPKEYLSPPLAARGRLQLQSPKAYYEYFVRNVLPYISATVEISRTRAEEVLSYHPLSSEASVGTPLLCKGVYHRDATFLS